MIGLLSDGGLKIIAKDLTTGQYYVKTDHINGALGSNVTVGGFNISEKALTSGEISAIGTNAERAKSGIYIGTDGISMGQGSIYFTSGGGAFISGGINIVFDNDFIEIVLNAKVIISLFSTEP